MSFEGKSAGGSLWIAGLGSAARFFAICERLGSQSTMACEKYPFSTRNYPILLPHQQGNADSSKLIEYNDKSVHHFHLRPPLTRVFRQQRPAEIALESLKSHCVLKQCNDHTSFCWMQPWSNLVWLTAARVFSLYNIYHSAVSTSPASALFGAKFMPGFEGGNDACEIQGNYWRPLEVNGGEADWCLEHPSPITWQQCMFAKSLMHQNRQYTAQAWKA